ncbi:MAG: helix-turn-helix domain-containing protein [Thermoplasmata archaeon]|nr:helix-turn-helix domain-containing protein [Thermoplasmata archaeon]
MRKSAAVRLHWEQRHQLLAVAESPTTPPRVALRARIALRASDGAPNTLIARELRTNPATVALWRRRFLSHGVAGVARDAPRSGRPPTISAERIQEVLNAASDVHGSPEGRVSVRRVAQRVGLSKSTVQRICHTHGLLGARRRPPRVSDRGMGFLETVTDLVGLYVNPPGKAVAFSTDERLRAVVPPSRGLLTSGIRPTANQAQEFRAFLQMMDRETPSVLEVHLLLDSRMSPVPPEVDHWLSRHPRFHIHPLPRDRVGLTLMDRLIDGFSRRKDRPGASASAHRLKYALRDHLRRNRDPLATFVWTATSGEIRGAHGRRGDEI